MTRSFRDLFPGATRWLLNGSRFGRLVLMTDQHEWTTAEIIGAYRGQAVIEGVFRTLKDALGIVT